MKGGKLHFGCTSENLFRVTWFNYEWVRSLYTKFNHSSQRSWLWLFGDKLVHREPHVLTGYVLPGKLFTPKTSLSLIVYKLNYYRAFWKFPNALCCESQHKIGIMETSTPHHPLSREVSFPAKVNTNKHGKDSSFSIGIVSNWRKTQFPSILE